MRDASEKKMQILDFIRREIDDKGYPPSVREICLAVGLKSTSTVHAHLNRLEEEGYIRRDATKPRALELTDTATVRGRSVPLVGRVTAGMPILAQQNIEEYYMLPQNLVGGDEVFILSVQGESMIEAGILDGDFVIVRRQSHAENGDIVVAMIDDEATVKRIFYEKTRVRLQPENSAMQPIYARDVTVLGRVIALFRQM
ncbi:MAG: transcriptional repressor LexA [Eubacteriales bacterium]|nr:transcriptional repressor LexA [Clostridiales bacterium]MDO4386104.1 transcriptional repressor LexA [Clostridia bacterium]MDY2770875.1 transcriptional repressor LexA [Eubacteriales bacterium]